MGNLKRTSRGAEKHKSTKAQKHKSTKAQKHKSTKAQKHKSTKAEIDQNQWRNGFLSSVSRMNPSIKLVSGQLFISDGILQYISKL